MFTIKRNTTPTLEVNIEFDIDKIQCLEFVFKQYPDEDSEELVIKKYTKEDLKTKVDDTVEGFVALVDLTREDTLKLPVGEVFMDTRIITVDDKTPRTDIIKGRVYGSLFKGAHTCD